MYKTVFIHNGIKIESQSFMDSGNSIKYEGTNLMICNLSLLLKFYPHYKFDSFKFPFPILDSISFNSLNTKGKMYITKLDKILIYNQTGTHIFNDVKVGINIDCFDFYDMLFSFENFNQR